MIRKKGFTLIEFLIAASIAAVIFFAVTSFAGDVFRLNRSSLATLNRELEVRQGLKTVTRELREAGTLVATSTDTLTITLDTNDDGSVESVRYFIEGGALKREVLGGTSVIAGSIENSSTTPLFVYEGNFVRVTMMLGGKSYISGATPRNIEDI